MVTSSVNYTTTALINQKLQNGSPAYDFILMPIQCHHGTVPTRPALSQRYCSCKTFPIIRYGGFLKWYVPRNEWYFLEKMIWGYQYSEKPSYPSRTGWSIHEHPLVYNIYQWILIGFVKISYMDHYGSIWLFCFDVATGI